MVKILRGRRVAKRGAGEGGREGGRRRSTALGFGEKRTWEPVRPEGMSRYARFSR